MDKEQARFILSSFRPDGADVGDPDFAEALKLAMENRELGEWLAHERAFDAAFAQALGSVDLPENLREDILACLSLERGDFPQADEENDAAWIGALASLQPPANLRNQVLAAMELTAARKVAAPPKISFFQRFGIPLAAAAGFALAFFLMRPAPRVDIVAGNSAMSLDVVKASFVQTYKSPDFSLTEKNQDPQSLIQHLMNRGLPYCKDLPKGLAGEKGIGCRDLIIDGKHGSLICFRVGRNGIVHLVAFRREDMTGDFPQQGQPTFEQKESWASARWQDAENIYLMMSDTQGDSLKELF